MFSVKICGITSTSDALAVAEAGGEAVGFNFYPPSPRHLRPEAARAIAETYFDSDLVLGHLLEEAGVAP